MAAVRAQARQGNFHLAVQLKLRWHYPESRGAFLVARTFVFAGNHLFQNIVCGFGYGIRQIIRIQGDLIAPCLRQSGHSVGAGTPMRS